MGIRLPERVRAVIAISVSAVFWAVFWYLHIHDLWSVVIGVIQGIIMGAAMWGMSRHAYRQAFVVDGRQASHDERTAAVAALRSGQLPAEPRLREVAIAFARSELGRVRHPWLGILVLGGVFVLMAVFLAIVYTPWSWLLAGCWVLLTAVLVGYLRRRQRRARSLLMALPLEPGELRAVNDGP